MQTTVNKKRSVRALLLASAALGVLGTPAGIAQAQELEEIVVTGSRIARPDYVANSPITTVTAEAFQEVGALTPENLLNQLPQVVPDITATSNNPPGQGQAQINLRGLGSNRNLVLINGRRPTPSTSTGVVDVNTIPTALIERVEVVSGGASAVYGADAVAGVVNFILNDNFEGISTDVQYGISEQGDAEEYSGSVTMGGNFADGRGNAVISVGYANRDSLSKGERDFTRQATSTTSFFPSGTFQPAGLNAPTQAAVDALLATYGAAPGSAPTNLAFGFNPDGTLFAVGSGSGTAAGFDVINYKGPESDIAENFFPDFFSFNFEPQNKLILPLERVNVTGLANYEIVDGIEAYMQATYTSYTAESALASSPAPTGTNITTPAAGAYFTVPVTNPFLSADLLALLSSRTGDIPGVDGAGATEDFLMRTRFTGLGPRVEAYDTSVYQVLGGLRGEFGNGWNWDAYAAHGKYSNLQIQDGNASVTRVEELLDAPDGGASICEGGLDLFGGNNFSEECADYIRVIAKNSTELQHDVVEASVSGDFGDFFSLPAGDIGFAVGALYWSQEYRFIPDQVLATGDVAGFNAQQGLEGDIENKDIYGEILVPVLSDLPFVQDLSLVGGYRYSDHSAAGTFSSYKIEADWQIVDALRVRGSYQRANRAPNIGELFSPQNEDNPQGSDPCDIGSDARTGANAAAVRQLCLDTGIAPAVIDNFVQTNDQFSALTGGNPDLSEESADTFTIGTVITSPFESDLLSSLSLSIDYYSIEIKDAISQIDAPTTVNRCYDPAYNPTLSASNEYCTAFIRDATGSPDQIEQYLRNLSSIETSGIDTQVDWRFDLPSEFGSLHFNLLVSWVDKWESQIAAGDAIEDYVGTIGDDIGDAIPEWKGTLSTTYMIEDAAVTLRTRYIAGMEHEYTVDGTNPDEPGVPPTWYFDLTGTYQVNDHLSLRAGVNNLLDQEVRLYPSNVQSGTDPSVYDVVGRRFFFGATARF